MNEFLKKQSGSKQVAKSAILMSTGTFVSRILGLVRDMVIGAFFSRMETDAFFVAFRVPNFFRRFLGEGALSISFIPVFIHCLSRSSQEEESQRRAKNFMNSVYTILLVFISVLTVVGLIYMDPLLRSLFADTPFSAIEEKIQMAVVMARWLFLYFFLVTLYAYFMGVANALGSFFIPAVAPAFVNLFIIIFSFLPKSMVSIPPLLLCWGVLTGGIVQVIITAVLLFRLGFLPGISFHFSGADLRLMGSRFLPGVFGVGGFAFIGLLNLYFAGWLEEGTHTYIYYGDRLLELPRSLIAISIGTALLPGLSHFAAIGERNRLLTVAADQRDMLLFLILPCALAFYYLGLPIVEVLFQRGKFDTLTSEKTALVLKIYSILLISSSLARVLATCFYAVRNTWYPAICSFLYVVFHWFFTPYMMDHFGLEGLVGATVISNCFFTILLMIAYPFFIGSFYLLRTVKRLLFLFPLLIGFAVYLSFSFGFYTKILTYLMKEGQLMNLLALLLVIISSIVLYFGGSAGLRLPQAVDFLGLIKKRMTR